MKADSSLEYHFFDDIAALLPDIPSDSIVSRTLVQEGGNKAILFGFAPGQELSEHTASVPAILHILEGEAQLTLAGDSRDARSGTWVYMPARMSHSILAQTRVVMLLLMLTAETA